MAAGAEGAAGAGSGGLALLGAVPGAPCCPHGPALLFVKTSQGKEEGRRFYACSACRDRKDCKFFQWEDEKVSQARLAAREEYNRSHQPPCTHRQNVERYKNFVLLPLSKRRFCQECQQLLLPDEWEEHSSHQFLYDISAAQLRSPSQLLYPLENKKTNAQYLFADRSCQFLLDLIISLGFRRVLSVGTPRLHEMIQSKALQEEDFRVRSLLLDIDFRYSQFYTEDEFCHYNMFNHYFFGGEAAHETCRKFLHEEKDERVIMVADPPFGGLVEALASSFKKLMAMWKDTEKGGNKNQEMPMFWIFPYFFESRILEFFPSFSMMDYQVDYDNHALYKHGKTGRRQSPVRIFTNLSPGVIVLPAEEGYRFCAICQRYVSSGNHHCEICNSCTSKDGRRWKHCVLCKKCVKPSWFHCNKCNCCALENHTCEKIDVGCFVCGKAGHKRSSCPSLSCTRASHQAGKGRRQKQKTLKTLKRAKLGVCKRWATKHAIFSRRKMKKKKKDKTT
ncbi:rRNA N6-adenosine-methyltransferase ZCCHC4 isoform X1 [Lagopus muta]|uniref:rRNA N6-adenosine-methyltransferase ZCCHC4 isoform X1 n=1 Tax=Lagopus muta TaxID=64668 RepID=UPI00209F68D3|nr:rRNA N6-adenosine-methyltransferase ZCCHC4 isoform X1 [Lagopus muta]XP_048797972.1 rRNA N6-adenosine-methyltransferase ZCCHC4 isoform X1 [Lagopus muta]